jgi:hypothetical protein
MIKPMSHKTAAYAQIGLSYFFLAGFFASLVLQGLGYLKLDVLGGLKDVLMLVMSFWFMRQRTTGDEPPPSAPHVTATLSGGTHAPTSSPTETPTSAKSTATVK